MRMYARGCDACWRSIDLLCPVALRPRVRRTDARQPAWERPDVRAALAIYLRSLIYRGIELYLRSLACGIEPYPGGACLSPPRAD